MAGALNAGVHRAAEAARGKKVRDNLEDNIIMYVGKRETLRGGMQATEELM